MSKNKRKKLRGKVQKVLRPIVPLEPEKAQISVEEADELYREIRIENVLTDENGWASACPSIWREPCLPSTPTRPIGRRLHEASQ